MKNMAKSKTGVRLGRFAAAIAIASAAAATGAVDAHAGQPPSADLLVDLEDPSFTGSVGWGQPIVYTLVILNEGPSAVTGAIVTDTMPAQLTGVTWTCVTASGGGACSASGTGSISDTVTLPSQSGVQYTIHATVIAGTGASTVSYVASVADPVGTTDPNLANNTETVIDTIATADTLTLTKNGAQAGTITSNPAVINCGTTCATATGAFLEGSSVTLNETPAAGWTFTGWTGECAAAGAATSCHFTMTGDEAAGATFVGPPASIAVSAGSPQTGTVGTAFALGLNVLVADVLGDPVAGAVVTYTAPSTGATAIPTGLAAGTNDAGTSDAGTSDAGTNDAGISDAGTNEAGADAGIPSVTAVTNSAGIASITVTAGAVAGTYAVIASVPGVATTASFALTNVLVVPDAGLEGGPGPSDAGDSGPVMEDAEAGAPGTEDAEAGAPATEDAEASAPEGDDATVNGDDATTAIGAVPSGYVTGGGASCRAAPGSSTPLSGAAWLAGLVGLALVARSRRKRSR